MHIESRLRKMEEACGQKAGPPFTEKEKSRARYCLKVLFESKKRNGESPGPITEDALEAMVLSIRNCKNGPPPDIAERLQASLDRSRSKERSSNQQTDQEDYHGKN